MLENYLGLASNEKNDFDEYFNQGTQTIKDAQGVPDLLDWWRNHNKGISNLHLVVRDVLVIQASSVASNDTFSATKTQIREHNYLLAPENQFRVINIIKRFD